MRAEMDAFGSEHGKSLERLAAIVRWREEPEDAAAGRILERLLLDVAKGIADPDDPRVADIVDAFTPTDPVHTDACVDADPVEPSVVAALLDRLAAHDRGPDGGGVAHGPDPTVDPLDGAAVTPACPVSPRWRSGDPIAQWRHEMSQLFRGSVLADPEVAAELHRRGVHLPVQSVLEVPEEAHAVQALVEVLGGRWVEDNFRTLYEAARREKEPDTTPAVQRQVSGLASADAVDVARVGALIQPSLHDVPRLLSRQRLIAQLAGGLDEPKRPTQVLVGAGGYGKSTVALATAQRAKARHIVPLWVPASDLDGLVDGLHRAAIWTGSTAVDIDAALSAAGERKVFRLWALLDAAPRPWFLVLDDVGPEAVGHPGWVHRSPAGTTVVTSRYGDPAAWGPDAVVIAVDVLTEEDGARLVLDRISVAGSKVADGLWGQARRLSGLLGGMPLALTAVGSMLASHRGGRTLAELVDRVQPSVAATAVATMYRICIQSFDITEHLPARHLLRLLATFAPGTPLPVHLLDGSAERNWSGRDGLDELIRVGLVEDLPAYGREPRCVRVHPAVAEHARHDSEFDAETAGRISLRAVTLLGAELERLDGAAPAAWLPIHRLEPHLAEVVDAAALTSRAQQTAALDVTERAAAAITAAGSHQVAFTLLDRALLRFDQVDDDDPVRLAARHTRAWMLTVDASRDLSGAQRALAAVLRDEQRVLGPDHPLTLTTGDALAWVVAEQGRLDGARDRFAEVLGRRTRVLGADHPDTLTTRHRLAWVDALRGREAAVVEEFRHVLDLRRARLGSDHMDVYATRYRLAWVLNKTGRHLAAQQHFAALQRDLELNVGESHPMTLIVRNRLAWTLTALDRFTAARATYRSLRSDQERVLGIGHPRVLATRLAQARLALHQGHLATAVPELRTVVDLYRDTLGDDHPRTLEARSWHAYALLATGRGAAAERGFRAVLADRDRLFGPRHPDVLQSRYFLGRALVRRGRLAEAEHHLTQLLDDELASGLEERNTLPTRHALARLVGLRGRYAESESGLRDVIADRTALIGADHRRTLLARDHLSWVLGRSGQVAEGLVVCREVLAHRRRLLGPVHRHTLGSRYREGWLVGLLGETEDSRRRLLRLLPDLQHALGDDHPETLRCRGALVRLARLRQELDVAKVQAERLVVDQRRVQGDHAVDTLRAREESALILIALGAVDGGRADLRDVLEIRLRVLGADHPESVHNRNLLA